MLCINPLTGTRGGDGAGQRQSRHARPQRRPERRATLRAPGRAGALRRARLPADRRRDAAGLGRYVLPGNNYHVYDYALFWANIRADAAAAAGDASVAATMITADAPPTFAPPCPTAAGCSASTSAPRRSASRFATPAGPSPARPRLIRRTKFAAGSRRRCGAWSPRSRSTGLVDRPAAQPRRQR